MPIYEYQCKQCHHHEEVLQKISELVLTVCPQCNQTTFNKVISLPAGFELKGTGWYVTDFKGPDPKSSDSKNSSN